MENTDLSLLKEYLEDQFTDSFFFEDVEAAIEGTYFESLFEEISDSEKLKLFRELIDLLQEDGLIFKGYLQESEKSDFEFDPNGLTDYDDATHDFIEADSLYQNNVLKNDVDVKEYQELLEEREKALFKLAQIAISLAYKKLGKDATNMDIYQEIIRNSFEINDKLIETIKTILLGPDFNMSQSR